MPVSPVPVLFPLAVLGILIGGIILTWMTYSRCRALRHVAMAIALLVFPVFVSQLKGLVVHQFATGGNPRWQLAYADWLMQERNLHQELFIAPGFTWEPEVIFAYISSAAAQGHVPAMRKYMGWVDADAGRQGEILQVQANYNAYRRQLGDVADFSYWRESTLLRDLMLPYAAFAILVQVLMWREEWRYQERLIQKQITPSNTTRGEMGRNAT